MNCTIPDSKEVSRTNVLPKEQANFLLLTAWKEPIGESPMLMDQLMRFKKEKPFQGCKILHCLPITHATLRKVDALIQGGAEVSLMAYQGIPTIVQEECIRIAEKVGIRVFRKPQDVTGYYDYFLDCNAQLLTMTKTIPRFGYVEITRSGVETYKKQVVDLPVVSIDDSRSKLLETIYGTGDGAVRALREVSKIDLVGIKVIVFGYGKVGIGAAKFLEREKAEVIVIDVDDQALAAAKSKGFQAVKGNDENAVRQAVSQAAGVITATGVSV